MMINRKLLKKIIYSLENFPVVGILGSRQVGKTTLAKELKKIIKKSVYIDLELDSDLNKLYNAELYFSQYNDYMIIIDEVQRKPNLFKTIRAIVDKNIKPGKFLILGSASLDLIKQSSESLAGRIIYHELTPFQFNEIEINGKNNNNLWIKGGYPLSYLADNNKSFIWRKAFIKTYLERDIPQLGINISSIQLKRFWMMIAHTHGQIWNASQISRSLGVSAPTVKHYLDILEETFVVRQLQPYLPNLKKRIIKSPKIFLRDSGLLHALLNIKTINFLQGNPIIGHSWEGFVIEQIINNITNTCEAYFYRTIAGAEIDLILSYNNSLIAIEIKYSLSPKVTKGFWISFNDLKCKIGFIIYPGEELYYLKENIIILPFKQLNKLFKIISESN